MNRFFRYITLFIHQIQIIYCYQTSYINKFDGFYLMLIKYWFLTRFMVDNYRGCQVWANKIGDRKVRLCVFVWNCACVFVWVCVCVWVSAWKCVCVCVVDIQIIIISLQQLDALFFSVSIFAELFIATIKIEARTLSINSKNCNELSIWKCYFYNIIIHSMFINISKVGNWIMLSYLYGKLITRETKFQFKLLLYNIIHFKL